MFRNQTTGPDGFPTCLVASGSLALRKPFSFSAGFFINVNLIKSCTGSLPTRVYIASFISHPFLFVESKSVFQIIKIMMMKLMTINVRVWKTVLLSSIFRNNILDNKNWVVIIIIIMTELGTVPMILEDRLKGYKDQW